MMHLVLNGQLSLYQPEKLVSTTFELPQGKYVNFCASDWNSKMTDEYSPMPLVTIGNISTCPILLNTNYSS